jgi:hypothetical protein
MASTASRKACESSATPSPTAPKSCKQQQHEALQCSLAPSHSNKDRLRGICNTVTNYTKVLQAAAAAQQQQQQQ